MGDYTQLWIDYGCFGGHVRLQQVLNLLKQRNIGQSLFLPYEVQAEILEDKKDFEGANAIFQKAIKATARPLEVLFETYHKFKLRWEGYKQQQQQQQYLKRPLQDNTSYYHN